eukprot:3182646-Rhodomonas_salina.3
MWVYIYFIIYLYTKEVDRQVDLCASSLPRHDVPGTDMEFGVLQSGFESFVFDKIHEVCATGPSRALRCPGLTSGISLGPGGRERRDPPQTDPRRVVVSSDGGDGPQGLGTAHHLACRPRSRSRCWGWG